MRHNIRKEFRESMDAIRFSQDAKDVMVDTLLAQMETQEAPRRPGGKKLLLVGLAAAVVLGTLTGAAVFTRWSKSAQSAYNPSQQIKEQAEMSGLSVMLDNKTKETGSKEVLSATDQGITITAVQSIVDNYGAELTFRIEGFDLPEGRFPYVWPVISIDGTKNFYGSQSGAFYDGTTLNEQGEWVYADGSPVKHDNTGSVILNYTATDGSLEYTHYIYFQETDGRYFGKEIEVYFQNIGIQSTEKAGTPEPLVDGSWDLHWTLTGADNADHSFTVPSNTKIGDSGMTLLEAEIGQKSIRAVYQLDQDWDGWKEEDGEREYLPHDLQGVRLKNGDMILVTPGSTYYDNLEKTHTCEIHYSTFRALLDLSQVESLAFHKGWEMDENGKPTIETFYYVPVG